MIVIVPGINTRPPRTIQSSPVTPFQTIQICPQLLNDRSSFLALYLPPSFLLSAYLKGYAITPNKEDSRSGESATPSQASRRRRWVPTRPANQP
ncbi:hypothetical protein GWI33_022217 [Rhynchophorus ferrugineus]|uniref:Uncharacterized protein n=1 Tax=Rhynchophorus ferrugineus TaxID=354439 RepID=A0A834IQB6_RHYFE|nr:hypothetical protein GWI33_022217 [Rhynchophorus ferrugineus]